MCKRLNFLNIFNVGNLISKLKSIFQAKTRAKLFPIESGPRFLPREGEGGPEPEGGAERHEFGSRGLPRSDVQLLRVEVPLRRQLGREGGGGHMQISGVHRRSSVRGETRSKERSFSLYTEFPIPSFVRFRHVLFWEFPCPA